MIAIVAGSCAITALVIFLVTRSCAGTREQPIAIGVPDAAAVAIVDPDAAVIANAIPDARVADKHVLAADELALLIRDAGVGSGKHPDTRRPEIAKRVDTRAGSGSASEPQQQPEPARQPEPERQPEPVRQPEPERPPEPKAVEAIRERVAFAAGSFSSSEVPRALVARIQAAIKAAPSRKVIVTGSADADESRDPRGLAASRANAVMLALTSGLDRIPRGSIVTRVSDGAGRWAEVELSP